MKIFHILAFVLVFSFFSCQPVSRKGKLTILHTNDMHSQFVPLPASWIDVSPPPQIGGMVALDYFIQSARSKYPQSILLDAGDMSTGTLLSKLEYNNALNGGFVEMMNLIKYDAFTIGNHEFDEGQENLNTLLALANFDILSANLFKDNKLFAPKAYEIYKIGKLRIGVIGLLLSDLPNVAARKNLLGIQVADPVQSAQHIINKIDAKTDLIIILSHQGDNPDYELAGQIKNADIIVGGHSHTRLSQAVNRNGILIVQAGAKTRYLGRLTVDVSGDTISSYESELLPVWIDSVKSENPQMRSLVDKFQKQIDEEYGQKIGTLKTAWKKHNHYETNLGDFLTDVIREKTETDFALLNSGGIRKDLPAGPITKMDILEILPFSNYVVTFECTGDQLALILKNDVEGSINGDYGLYQISGIKYIYKVAPDSSVSIESLTINDAPVDFNKIYKGTTVDFVLTNLQDNFKIQNINITPYLISDAVIEFIEKNPIIESRMQDRIVKKSN